MSYEVYINNRPTGIIETNYTWAKFYWARRARRQNCRISLKVKTP